MVKAEFSLGGFWSKSSLENRGFFGEFLPACFPKMDQKITEKSTAETKHLNPRVLSGKVSLKYGFGEYGFKHGTQGVVLPSPSSGERTQFLSAYYLCAKVNSPSFSQNAPSLPQNSVRLSEFSPPKQYSRNSIPPVSYTILKQMMADEFNLLWSQCRITLQRQMQIEFLPQAN